MPAYAVLGAQWGDEGKGKIIDFLARDADVVARFSVETMPAIRSLMIWGISVSI